MKKFSLSALSEKTNVIIANYVSLTFYGYFSIGLTLAVLPIFIHVQLGYNTIIAGAVISVQYIMTLFMRAYAGNIVDRRGPKPAVITSMLCFILAGVLLIASFLTFHNPGLSLMLLIISRLLTGCGEGMVGASPVNWAMLHVGEKHTATAISYNGIANYSSLAIGAPLGIWMSTSLGNWSIGGLTILIGLVGLGSAFLKPALQGYHDDPGKSFFEVFKSVSPYGAGLALAGIGFGTLSTFVTLYYAYQHWDQAASCITAFSVLFITGRLFFAGAISKYGGIKVSIVCLAVESLGMLVLWLASSPEQALFGAALTGLGFSLVFPALGVEAVSRVQASNKGAALGAYGVFIDISLGITGPLVGLVAKSFGMNYIFPFSMTMVLMGLVVCTVLKVKTEGAVKEEVSLY